MTQPSLPLRDAVAIKAISTCIPPRVCPLTNPFPSLTGRVELRLFLVLYFLSLPFQLLTTGSVLEQGSLPLTVITAIHGGIVAALFWGLLANALVATQMVEDGTLSSLVVSFIPLIPLAHGF